MVNKGLFQLNKQCQTRLKEATTIPQTSYGPEGRGFESLRAYQSHENSLDFRGFVLTICTFSGGLILLFRFDPSRDPYGNLERLGSESTGEEIPHRVRRLLLHRGRDVCVGIQSESRTVATQHCGESFHVYSVLQCQHGECVT